MKILANDGIHPSGQSMLEKAGFEVNTNKIAQEDLLNELPNYDVIIVRSATKVREELINACPNLKIIARGGVGLDNIDVDYAKSKGIAVINTPAASSESVAELVFGHFINLARSLNLANRDMGLKGDSEFKQMKKSYSKGTQLRGKTLGIIGFGRIGIETARIGLGLGMKVLPVDPFVENRDLSIDIQGVGSVTTTIATVSMNEMLENSDFISLHVPSTDKPIIANEQIGKMKDGVILVNASRGGSIDEDALLKGISSGKIRGAGLDVFVGEPTPRKDILTNDKISSSPHIGAATEEAQENIGTELGTKIIAYFKK